MPKPSEREIEAVLRVTQGEAKVSAAERALTEEKRVLKDARTDLAEIRKQAKLDADRRAREQEPSEVKRKADRKTRLLAVLAMYRANLTYADIGSVLGVSASRARGLGQHAERIDSCGAWDRL